MNKIKKILGTVMAIAIMATMVLGMNVSVMVGAEGTSYSVKTYTPDRYDFVDFYGGAGDINPEDGDGVTTFAHAGLVTPLNGANIEFNTSFKLLSKKDTDQGGNGVDGWVTYSFAKTPADITSGDLTVPSYANETDGVFLHITNFSGTTAPNCVEVQIVQRLNKTTSMLFKDFVDNICDVRITFNLKKGDDGTYTWTAKDMSTGSVIKTVENLTFDESAFVNANGQTYFSTAIYEGAGCDGNHWEHRGVSVYSVSAYTADVLADCVTLSQSEYTFEEGNSYSPDVTVTIGVTELVKGEDYDVAYVNNNAVGTATVKVTFYGEYGGNAVEKTYEIKEASVTPPIDNNGDSSNNGTDTEDKKEGCGSSMYGVSTFIVAAFVSVAAIALIKKRKQQ